MKISCIVIDDEPNAVHLLQDYIAKTPLLEIKGAFFDAMDALTYLRQNQAVDIIFTDINMPVLSGMDLAELLPRSQKIIFTTAYSEHALPSFSFYVIDYLLKPISFKRFNQAIAKLEGHLTTLAPTKEPPKNDFIFIKNGKETIKILFDEISYVSGAKEYVNLHKEKSNVLMYKRMKEMEKLLPPHFIRVHHSYIINTKYLDKIAKTSVIIGKNTIPVSDGYKAKLLAFMINVSK